MRHIVHPFHRKPQHVHHDNDQQSQSQCGVQIVCRRCHRRNQTDPIRHEEEQEQRHDERGQESTSARAHVLLDLVMKCLNHRLHHHLPVRRRHNPEIARREPTDEEDDDHRDPRHHQRLRIEGKSGDLHCLANTDFVHNLYLPRGGSPPVTYRGSKNLVYRRVSSARSAAPS